jgi:RNA polymerase primary sigma factor
MSLAAMEATLKPKVLETLEHIARDLRSWPTMQEQRMSATCRTERFPAAEEAPIRSCAPKSCCW